MTAKTKTTTYDTAEYLHSEEDIARYLTAILEEDDPSLLAAALGDVARAKGMTELARETGLARESLYRSLSSDGNPTFSTVQKILNAFGVTLRAQPSN